MVKAGKVAALVLQLYLVCIFSLHRRPLKERLDYTHAWSSLILKAFGIALVIDPQIDQATSQPSSFLYVSNHLSWVDIVVIQAHTPCLFVSKSQAYGIRLVGEDLPQAETYLGIFEDNKRKKKFKDLCCKSTRHPLCCLRDEERKQTQRRKSNAGNIFFVTKFLPINLLTSIPILRS